MTCRLLLLFVFSFYFQTLFSCPIHEAFLTKEAGETILQSVATAPPADIEEKTPEQKSQDLLWIPGYFAWSDEKRDYVWISGIWRRPPPDKKWVPGRWEQRGENWVRFPGFWRPASIHQLKILEIPLPDEMDERVATAPAGDFFWMPGHWAYDEKLKNFVWHSGRFVAFDKDWVYTPGHYIWREGYIFIPAYWDWPIEKRGFAYPCVEKPDEGWDGYTHFPKKPLQSHEIVKSAYSTYPYYLVFFHHHYHYHPDFWGASGAVPPWWKWDAWWTLAWYDQYWLWWWWTHPGYPHPSWLPKETAKKFPPPPQNIVEWIGEDFPPPIATPNGFVSPSKLTSEEGPILPPHGEAREAFIKKAAPEKPGTVYNPSGSEPIEAKEMTRPSYGPLKQDLKYPPGRVSSIPKPALQQPESRLRAKPQITPRPRAPEAPSISLRYSSCYSGCGTRHSTLGQKRPLYSLNMTPSDFHPPGFSHNYRPLVGPESPQMNPPPVQYKNGPLLYAPPPQQPPPGVRLNTEQPFQGQAKVPYIPPTPFAQQNLGDFMNNPMPQINQGISTQYPQGAYQGYSYTTRP